MSHDVLSLSAPAAASRFRTAAVNQGPAAVAPAEAASFAPDAFVASADKRWFPPQASPIDPADLKVMCAEMRVLRAEVALANARVERLLTRLAKLEVAPADVTGTDAELPSDDDVAPADVDTSADVDAPTDAPAVAPAFDQEYKIVWGDTLNKLAQRFGTTVEALAEANGIENPDLIYAGDTIRVPAQPSEAAPAPVIADAPALTIANAPATDVTAAATNAPATEAPALPPLPIPGA